MSELKGQILGILLVILMFGIVSATMTAVFSSTSARITSEYEANVTSLVFPSSG